MGLEPYYCPNFNSHRWKTLSRHCKWCGVNDSGVYAHRCESVSSQNGEHNWVTKEMACEKCDALVTPDIVRLS